MQEVAATGQYGQLPKGWRIFSKVLLIAIPALWFLWVLNLPIYLGIPVMLEQFLGLIFALAFGAIFLIVPATKNVTRDHIPWYDIIFAFLSMAVGGYAMLFFAKMSINPEVNPVNVALGSAGIIVTLEATRRLIGWVVVVVGIAAVLITIFGYQFHIHQMPSSTQEWIWFFYLDTSTLFGLPLHVLTVVVLAFLIFGRLLFATGGADIFINLSMSLMGRFSGGPAKVAVIASSLFGTIAGSPSANAATTGSVTIPLMKRTGYSPEFAAAVEASASTGGIVLPPVMGIVAFLIAEFLAIPYAEVAIAAFLPAVLFYISVFAQVHLKAVSQGLIGLPPKELPSKRDSLKASLPLLIPIGAIVYPLFVWMAAPEQAALYGIYGVLAIALINRKGLANLRKLPRALEDTGRAFLDLAAIGAIGGLVVGCLLLTGLGLKLGILLLAFAESSLWLLLVPAAIVSLIMGMGMPVIVIYIILAILVAPAMTQTGVPALAAHLFIFWWGTASFVTPPICAAVFVTRSIAQSDFIKTAMLSTRLALGMYIIPFAFILREGLLMTGSASAIVYSFLACAVGLISLTIALEGYGWVRLTWPERVVMAIGGLAILAPTAGLNIIGGGVIAILTLQQWRRQRRQLKVYGNVS